MVSSTMTTARWRTLSSNVGIPIGRVSVPVPFGICTRRTGGARYVPDLARSRRSVSFGGKQGNRILIPRKSGEDLQQSLVIPAGDKALAAQTGFAGSVLLQNR